LAKRQIFFPCLFAVSMAAAANPARAAEYPGYQNLDLPYCTALGQLNDGFNDGFKSLKGTLYDAGQDLKVWSSNVVLPGAKRCDIWQTDTGETLSCELTPASGEEESQRIFQEHRESIGRCLGEGWLKEESVLPGPGQGTRFLTKNSQTGSRIELQVKSAGSEGGYSVEFALSLAPASPVAATPPQEE